MDDLKERLDTIARSFEPGAGALERTLRRAERRGRRRRVGTMIVVAALVAGSGIPLWRAFPNQDIGPRSVGVAEIGIDLTVQLPRGVSDIAVSPDSAWVAHPGGVQRLDPTTGKVLADTEVAGADEFSSLTLGDGDVWVTSGDRLVRIDAVTGDVRARTTLDGTLLGVAFGEGSVWVTRATEAPPPPVLVRVDPASGEILGTTDIGPGPGPVVTGGGFVWGSNTSSPTALTRIDPATGELVHVAGVSPSSLAFGAGSLWLTSEDEVLRIDGATARIVARIPLPRAEAIAFANDTVWVLSGTGSTSKTLYLPDPEQPAKLVRIDPAISRIVGNSIAFDEVTPASLAADGAGVWVSFYDSGVVHRIRPCPQDGCPQTTDQTGSSDR